jgi:hypothetical protein
MHSRPLLPALLGASLLLSAAIPAYAESVAYVGDGQRITGTVPVGEVIRLTIPLPQGGTPRLNLSLKGSRVTLSFKRSDLYDPDGNLIPDTSRFFEQKFSKSRSTLRLRDFVAPVSGDYQLVIETNSERLPDLVELRASGKLKVSRVTRLKERFSVAGARIDFGLQARDRVKATVKRVSGDTPTIAAWITPAGTGRPPPQKSSKKGSSAGYFPASGDGTHSFEFGYRDAGVVGEYQATVKIKPVKSKGGLAILRLANAPGIPLSVRGVDRSAVLAFGQGAPGVAYDGTYVLASALDTSSGSAEIRMQFLTADLFPLFARPDPVPVVTAADMQPGQSVGGHRALFAGGHHVVLWWTASGANLGMVRLTRALLRSNSIEAIVGSGVPIADPFLASDGTRISFGVADVPFGHLVRVFESDFSKVGDIQIGGGPYSHGNGAGAAWVPGGGPDGSDVFEFWAPDTTDPSQLSDLHRHRYSALWQPQGAAEKPIGDLTVTETMPTAVVHDLETQVTIVHYVVPTDLSGAGVIHRALFDATGALVPGSHVALDGDGRNRPSCVIAGNSLYLGFEGPNGPEIERHTLLRTTQEP